MKVVHLSEYCLPYRGGGQFNLNEVTKREVGSGWDVTIFTNRLSGTPDRDDIDGARVVRLGVHGEVGSPVRRWKYIRDAARSVSEMEGVDLIHSHVTAGSLAGVKAARNSGVPHVTTVHALISMGSDMLPEKSTPWYQRKLEHYILKKPYDRVIALSNVMKGQLEHLGTPPERIRVIPNGVDHNRFTPEGPVPKEWPFEEDDFVLLFYGRLWEVKGIPHLLNAVERVCPDIPELKVVLIGSGPEEDNIDAIISRYPLKDRVVRIPEVDQVQLPGYLRRSDLFVLPSLSEGVPLSLLEAQMIGTPVLATRVGGVPELVEHRGTGYLVPPSDPGSLGEGVVYALENPKETARWAKKARERALASYTWDIVVEQTMQVCRELVEGEA